MSLRTTLQILRMFNPEGQHRTVSAIEILRAGYDPNALEEVEKAGLIAAPPAQEERAGAPIYMGGPPYNITPVGVRFWRENKGRI